MDTNIGQPVVRRDGAAKASGSALYAADFAVGDVAYAALTLSPVAKGRITRVDATDAEAVPGVQMVLTHRSLNASFGEEKFVMLGGHMQSSFMPLTSDEVHYAGQIVGVTIADTLEAAEQAARLLNVEYASVPAVANMDAPDRVTEPMPDKSIDKGNAQAAFAISPVKVDATYMTPVQHHNPIELYSTTASWQDNKLTVQMCSQWVIGTRVALAAIFGIAPEDVHVVAPYTGGGFGAKATILPHTVLVALAARRLGRPVKLVVPRDAMFTVGSFRPATISRVALAAERDGTLTAVIHEEAGQTAEIDYIAFPGTQATALMYDSPNIRTREGVVKTDVNTPGFQRAPAEAPAFFGFESAMDELAVALGMDPIELRIKNEPAVDPVHGRPWSSRSLVPCFRRGAKLFGWDRRTPGVGSMKTADGLLIGYGCATAAYPSATAPSRARVVLKVDGSLHVATAAHDVGTGAYTVLGQVAASVLGIDDARVTVELGDSTLPSGPLAGGSITTGSAGSAIQAAALQVRTALLAAAARHFPGVDLAALELAGGHVVGPDGSARAISEVLTAPIDITADWKPDDMEAKAAKHGLDGGLAMSAPEASKHPSYSFGAQFAEVHIDPLLRTIRVPRMVGVFACGRIINRRTAHSNLAGGMIWGASFALLEETQTDGPRARFANQDLATYHVPTSADIGEVIVETLDEVDTLVNPIGAKGVGEVGIVGMPAAIANAVYHATGIRVRKTPIQVEDLL